MFLLYFTFCNSVDNMLVSSTRGADFTVYTQVTSDPYLVLLLDELWLGIKHKTIHFGHNITDTVILLKKMLTQKLLSNLGFLSSDPKVDVSLIVSIPPMLH